MEGASPTGYTSIEAIQQGMASARGENHYNNLKEAKPRQHYSDFSNEAQLNNGEHYNNVSLTQLNAEVEEHKKAQLKPDHSQYDDITLENK